MKTYEVEIHATMRDVITVKAKAKHEANYIVDVLIAEEIRKDPDNEKIVGVKINNVKEQDNDIR